MTTPSALLHVSTWPVHLPDAQGKPETILAFSLLPLPSSSPSASRSALLQCLTTGHHPHTAGTLAGALSAHLLYGSHLLNALLLPSFSWLPTQHPEGSFKTRQSTSRLCSEATNSFSSNSRKAKIFTRANEAYTVCWPRPTLCPAAPPTQGSSDIPSASCLSAFALGAHTTMTGFPQLFQAFTQMPSPSAAFPGHLKVQHTTPSSFYPSSWFYFFLGTYQYLTPTHLTYF